MVQEKGAVPEGFQFDFGVGYLGTVSITESNHYRGEAAAGVGHRDSRILILGALHRNHKTYPGLTAEDAGKPRRAREQNVPQQRLIRKEKRPPDYRFTSPGEFPSPR